MLIPLICFLLGGLILLYDVLVYGSLLFTTVPEGFRRRDMLIYFVGYALIALALMLGLAGYLSYLSPEILRPTRIGMGIVGSILLFYQFLEITARP